MKDDNLKTRHTVWFHLYDILEKVNYTVKRSVVAKVSEINW